jgi:hypothetical protein
MILSRQQLQLEALRRIGVIPPTPQQPKAEEKPAEKPKGQKRKRKE